MNILIAPDKFKGSLTAPEVCDAISRGVREKYPDAKIKSIPLADGGEGTSEQLTQFFQGITRSVEVTGPLFEKVMAQYGLVPSMKTAFIEMAKASGLQLVEESKRNPLHTTSRGTGELILDAIGQGATRIILGIGGSATNDAGIGMADALGYEFLDINGNKLKPVGESLSLLNNIKPDRVLQLLEGIQIVALCDVENPLYGPGGAAYVYAPQKGADKDAVEMLDQGLRRFEQVVQRVLGVSADFRGAGAGGGMASGAKIFLRAEISKGIDYVMKVLDVEKEIVKADLIITGEGKIDQQTLSGKVVGSVARAGASQGKKVIAICGVCELRKNEMEKIGISQVISLTDPFTSTEDAVRNAGAMIRVKIREAL